MGRFSKGELFDLRNRISVLSVIKFLNIPHKEVEGVERFLCPKCGEFNTGINPNTNLSRCFLCKTKRKISDQSCWCNHA